MSVNVEAYTNACISEYERQRKLLKFRATRDGLRVERECPHSLIAYCEGSFGEYFGPHPTICVHCRMAWHSSCYNNPSREHNLSHRFMPFSSLGLRNIYALRASDSRQIIKSERYDCLPPKRKPRRKGAR